MAKDSFLSGAGTGAGAVIGAVVALVAILGLGDGYVYLSEPIADAKKPAAPIVGTASQARATALNALRRRGIASLADETHAVYNHVEHQWMVTGPAEMEDGRLTEVDVLLTVGTVRGKLHWKLAYMKIGEKEYVGD